MKRICNFSIIHLIILGLILAINSSCDKEVDPKLLPTLTTIDVINITEATAYVRGNIIFDVGVDVTSRGVCWSELPNPTIEDKKNIDADGTSEFETRITGLNPATTYYVRAYATNKKGIAYGLQVTFKTKTLTITTTPITDTDIRINSATSGGTLGTDGDSLNVFERGICWSTTASPTIESFKKTNGKGKGNYSVSMTGLQISTQYFVRAYAKNETGIFYGNEISVTTTNGTITLTTSPATSITGTKATSGGTITNTGGASISARGICWSTNPNPTITDNKATNGTEIEIGTYNCTASNLSTLTTYYLRAYATNAIGTFYGNEISFVTTTSSVGDPYQGGIIAYFLQAGDPGYDANVKHGIIAAPSNQSTGAVWGCDGSAISGADGTAIGTGAQNTIDIVNGCSTAGIAARLCLDLVLGGYSDWYLPSRDELNKLNSNKTAVGGFANGYYWSSSEESESDAWRQYFGAGSYYSNSKTNPAYVRAVRSF